MPVGDNIRELASKGASPEKAASSNDIADKDSAEVTEIAQIG
jgi:hypothetical protein